MRPRYLDPAPPERLATLRILVVGFTLGYLVVRAPHLLDVARLADVAPQRFAPVGPLVVLDRPPAVGLTLAVLAATVAAAVAGVAGWRWRISGPAVALGFLLVTSHRSSWGQVFHTENLVALHLLVLAVVPAADARSLDARRRARTGAAAPGPDPRYGWPVRLAAVIVVVAYVLAGWAKLRTGGLDWVTGDALRHHVAHDNLRKALVGDVWSPLGGRAVAHAGIFPPLAAVSLLVELAAPVALLGGRWRTIWVGAAWMFHLGVLALMAIMFPYPLLGIAFAPFFALEHLGRRRRPSPPPPTPDAASPTPDAASPAPDAASPTPDAASTGAPGTSGPG